MIAHIDKGDWNKVYAAHLLNRAGFGATPSEIEAAASRNPQDLVEELVEFQKIPEKFGLPSWLSSMSAYRPQRGEMRNLPEEERREKFQEMRKIDFEHLAELRSWWLYRMRYSPRPLQEKLTLFWHGHFATSFEKVKPVYALYKQNEMFRRMANGNLEELVTAVAKDPAMLLYLDNAQNRAEHPNENFARELMELFTLGEGHYTEEDIKESARAFTGWTIDRTKFEFSFSRPLHDNGSKKFMGKRGAFDGADIIKIILQQPNAAPYIVKKMWEFFTYDEPDAELVTNLANELKSNRYEFKPFLKTMFLSKEFYSSRAIRTSIKSPVQWLIGSSKALEGPLPSGDACFYMLRTLGQELFAPPNVKGWDGGYTWITTANLFNRYNFAMLLVKGGDEAVDKAPDDMFTPQKGAAGFGASVMRKVAQTHSIVDAEKILPAEFRKSTDSAQKYLEWRLFQGLIRESDSAKIRDSLTKAKLQVPLRWDDDDIKMVIHTMMSTAQYQLC